MWVEKKPPVVFCTVNFCFTVQYDSGGQSLRVSDAEGLPWKDLYYGKVLDDRWPLDSCWWVSEWVDTEHPVLVILRLPLPRCMNHRNSQSLPLAGFWRKGWGNARWVAMETRICVFLKRLLQAVFCHTDSFFWFYNSWNCTGFVHLQCLLTMFAKYDSLQLQLKFELW